MDVPLVIRHRLRELGLEQRDLAAVAQVTQSYISQLLARKTFGVEIVLNRRLTLGHLKRFEFVEREPEQPFDVEPGLEEFLKDTSLSGDATEEEIEFLKMLKFKGRRPAPIYYYRVLQNLRDPPHFPTAAQPRESD